MAPNNGGSCNSILKALKMSADLGLLRRPCSKSESSANATSRRQAKEGRRGSRPSKTPLLTKTPDEEDVEEDSEEEDNGLPLPVQPSNAAVSLKSPKVKPRKRNSNDRKHATHIPPQSQSTKTAQSTTRSVPSARPKPPYVQNLVGRMVWLRPKRDEMYWIRGRIEKCEQSRLEKTGKFRLLRLCFI